MLKGNHIERAVFLEPSFCLSVEGILLTLHINCMTKITLDLFRIGFERIEIMKEQWSKLTKNIRHITVRDTIICIIVVYLSVVVSIIFVIIVRLDRWIDKHIIASNGGTLVEYIKKSFHIWYKKTKPHALQLFCGVFESIDSVVVLTVEPV